MGRAGSILFSAGRAESLRALAVPKSHPQDSQLELTLYNSDYQPLARSVSRYWFGLPQVALLGLNPDSLDAYRINFRAEAGQTYYLKVTNGATRRSRSG